MQLIQQQQQQNYTRILTIMKDIPYQGISYLERTNYRLTYMYYSHLLME